ncbi:MAG: hypothetical protein QOH51_1259 [Acidobacteriota bacterium]|jgi:hypothetical protein|nr:hypothetical protein [Acidobacteriota bacterium]
MFEAAGAVVESARIRRCLSLRRFRAGGVSRGQVKSMAGEMKDGAHRKDNGARLDRMGREVVRASAAGEQEAEAVAASPFLYARVRASVEAERRRRETGESRLALLLVAWRAVPALALVAVLALALFLSAGAGELSARGFVEDSMLGGREGDIEQVVFADSRAPSSDEVLSTIIDSDEREAAK